METLMICITVVTGSNINYHGFTSAPLIQFQESAFIRHDQLHPNTCLLTIYNHVTIISLTSRTITNAINNIKMNHFTIRCL